mgnify:FL=1
MRIEEASSARQIAEISERQKRQKLLEKQHRENELKLSAKENAEAISKILNDLSLRIQKENKIELETTFRRNRRLQIFICVLTLLGTFVMNLVFYRFF